MNIAYFTDTYLPQLNGVSVSIQTIVERLRASGHRVFIFAPEIRGHKEEEQDVIRLKSFKVLSSEPEVLFPMLFPNKGYRKTMSLDFDLIHAHGNGAFSLLGYEVAQMRGIPYILTFHNLHTKYTHYIFKGKIVTPKMVAAALKVFGSISDGVIVPSEKMKLELSSFGLTKHIEVIANPIEIESFKVEDKGFLRRKFNISQKNPIILSVGRLGKEKNFNFIIKVFAKIHKKYPDSHFVLVGIGPEEKNLKALIRKLKLTDSIHFAGRIATSEMPFVYSGADIFVFASKTETQGMVVSEAAATGLPLVTVEDKAFSSIVTSKNGFFLPLLQKEFVEKISFLLDNPSARKKMGAESKLIAQKLYGPSVILENLINYYDKIISLSSERKRRRKILSTKFIRMLTRSSEIVGKFFR